MKSLSIYAMAFFALAMASAASAGNVTLSFSLYTDHVSERSFNENTQLMGVQVDSFVFAKFKNSYKQQSFILGKEKTFNDYFGFYYGAVYGYCWEDIAGTVSKHQKDCKQIAVPFAAPFVKFKSVKIINSYKAFVLCFELKGLNF